MNFSKTILCLTTVLILASCGSFSNEVENGEAVKPFSYEMTFQDSKEGAQKAFFNKDIPSFSYKIVVPGKHDITRERWTQILNEAHPDISRMNEIYYASGAGVEEKHAGIERLLNADADRTALHQSVLEQVASARMLHLLNGRENVAPEMVSGYLDKLLRHGNTSFGIQVKALNKVEGYWPGQKMAEARQKLKALAEAQLSEARTFLAAEERPDNSEGGKRTAENYEVMEAKTKVEILDRVLAQLDTAD